MKTKTNFFDRFRFRAWDGHKMQHNYVVGANFVSCLSVLHDEDFAKEQYSFSEWKIMQSSGLLDAKNTLVYEGDILDSININGSITRGLIIFVSGKFMVQQIGAERLTDDLCCHLEDSKVIGNVFESEEFKEFAKYLLDIRTQID
jgi:hypothetical protein